MRVTLAWFILFCIQLFGLGIGWHYHVQDIILKSDPTYIAFGILALQTIVMVVLGVKLFEYEREDNLAQLDLEWFWHAADSYVNIGMIGTVIGFIMGQTHFVNVTGLGNAAVHMDLEKLKTILQENLPFMLFGMFTALWATLAGLGSAQFLKTTLRYVEHHQDGSGTNETDDFIISDY